MTATTVTTERISPRGRGRGRGGVGVSSASSSSSSSAATAAPRALIALAVLSYVAIVPSRAFSPPPPIPIPPIPPPPSSRRRGGMGGGVRRWRSVSLGTVAAPASASVASAGVGAIAGAVSGGLFAGGLHAIAGPDHLAALLPRTCGQRWYRAGRIGALWGMGHGASATVLGVLAFALKNRVASMSGGGGGHFGAALRGASSVTEIAVGASLIVIGLLGIKEAREWESEIGVGGAPAQSLSSAAVDDGVKVAQKRAVVFNGVLHGFSWDGAPSLAPAVAVATWRGNIAFLLAYALGTAGAMALATTLIGEGTRRAGQILHRPDVPQKLSMASSVVAIAVGAVWCGLALK